MIVQVNVFGDGAYKMVVADSSGTAISTFDPVSGGAGITKINTIAELTAITKATLTNGDEFSVSGYYAQGDGGGGNFYWNSTSTATANGGTIIASDEGGTGRWLRIVVGDINVRMFGAVGDNSADDTVNIQNALTAAISGLVSLYIQGGTYKITSELEGLSNIKIYGDGASSILDGSTGTFASGKAVLNITGSITQIEDLNANVAIYDRDITLASTPSVIENDVIIIYNPTDSSWSTANATYRAGEYVKVVSISTNTLSLWNELYDSYVVADVDLYKLTPLDVTLSDFNVVGTRTGSHRCVQVEYGTHVRIDNVNSSGSAYAGIGVKNCYDVDVTGGRQLCNEAPAGLQYGFTIGNSQNIRINGGAYKGTRHGITIGGGDAVGSVTNRNININGASISNEGNGIAAADMHGNCEDVWYRNCQIDGAVSVTGKNTGAQNNRIMGTENNGVCVFLSDIKEGTFTVTGNRMISDELPVARGIVYGGVGSVSEGDCSFHIMNNTVTAADLASVSFMRLDCSNTTNKVNVHIRGLDCFNSGLSPNSVLDVRENTGATAASDYLVVEGVTMSGTPYLLRNDGAYSILPVLRLQSQSGQQEIASAVASNIVGSNQLYHFRYPVRPNVVLGIHGQGSGAYDRSNGYAAIPAVNLLGLSSITPEINTADSSNNWTTGTTWTIHWQVGIQDI